MRGMPQPSAPHTVTHNHCRFLDDDACDLDERYTLTPTARFQSTMESMQNWFTKPCAEHMAKFWSRQRAPLTAVITPSTSTLMLKIMSVIARQKTIWDICKSISSISTFELNRLDAETITKIPPNKLTLALP